MATLNIVYRWVYNDEKRNFVERFWNFVKRSSCSYKVIKNCFFLKQSHNKPKTFFEIYVVHWIVD